MENIIASLTGFIWQYVVIIISVVSGVYFTFRLGFIQIKGLKHGIELISGKYDNPNEKGEITHFQALSAALSGTIGLGNLSGVAVAIAMGGPGAIFWLWVIGFIGMATKYVECALGTIYREENPETGEVRGGPMYYIQKGLGKKWKPMAIFFAIATVFGSFGAGGMYQSNQAASAIETSFGIPAAIGGLILAALLGLVIIGGIKRIGKVASKIVPFMCAIYLVTAFGIVLTNITELPKLIMIILNDAFTGQAVMGGALGQLIMIGVRRAVFSNEAGLGSAPIAHAAVKTDYPIREGIVASLGPLIDTIIVCSATAFVILLSGFYGTGRYEAIQGFQFSNTQQSVGWSLSSEDTPTKQSSTMDLISGQPVLKFSSGQSNALRFSPPTPLTKMIPNLKNIDGLRFSMFSKKGQHTIHILDETSREIVKISTDPVHNKEALTLEGRAETNNWHSRVLVFDDNLKEKLSEANELYIQFSSRGASEVYFDKIETIKELNGINLTSMAFDKFIPGFGSIAISIGAFLFAFSTLITWSYYGETAIYYVFGRKMILPFKTLFLLIAFIGTISTFSLVLNLSDLMIGLMVIPNGIAILLLFPVIKKETSIYFSHLKDGKFTPYHQKGFFARLLNR